MRLTDISVRQLPCPAKGQRTYFDDTLSSFGCRVSQGGTRSFVVQHGADRQLITIGRYPIVSLAEARAEARRILAERTLGKHRPRSIAFEEAQKLFFASCQQRLRPSTVNDYNRLLKRHFAFGRRQLADIAPQDIARKIDRLSKTPSEQNHALVAAKVFFNWAVRRHYIDRSPCEGMALPARLAPRDRVLSESELASVYRTALSGSDTFARIVALLVLTGQRRSEISALRWEWIDPKHRTITLPASLTKNKREHTFPYGDGAASVLEAIPRQGDFLFPASRSHVKGRPTSVFNGWPKCKVAFDQIAGVTNYQLHDLRRTFATNLAALNTLPHVVERLLNHASGTISGVAAIYNRHSYMAEMREAVRKWEGRLAAIVSPVREAA
jgi:integrase